MTRPTPTERLTRFVAEQPPVPIHEREPPSEAEVRARLERARPHPAVHALLTVLVDRDTSFELFELRMYPAVLTREPWSEGVMTERDLCVAKNGAGDLYLWNVDAGDVRMVVHDEDWVARGGADTFDDWLCQALWTCLENLEPDDLDEMDAVQRARLGLAIEIAGTDAIRPETRARLAGLGMLEG